MSLPRKRGGSFFIDLFANYSYIFDAHGVEYIMPTFWNAGFLGVWSLMFVLELLSCLNQLKKREDRSMKWIFSALSVTIVRYGFLSMLNFPLYALSTILSVFVRIRIEDIDPSGKLDPARNQIPKNGARLTEQALELALDRWMTLSAVRAIALVFLYLQFRLLYFLGH